MPTPPVAFGWRLARWWLQRSLPGRIAPDVIGDLEEEFAEVAASRGRIARTVWLVRETVSASRPRAAASPATRSSVMTLAQLIPHLRFALRTLRRTPGFTTAAALTLAVGIGATAAIGSIVNQALLEPLPYPASARLAIVAETRRASEISVSYLDFLDWQSRATSFETMAGFVGTSYNLLDGGEPERVRGQFLSPGVFKILGVEPALGRLFAADEERDGAPRVAVLGDGLWRRRFGADPAIVGHQVRLDGDSYTVVGVMPGGFDFPGGIVYGPAEVYVPMTQFIAENRADLQNRGSHPGLAVVGLLKPGVTIAGAQRELDVIAAQLERSWPDSNRQIGVVVRDGITALVGDLGRPLAFVAAAAALVLLIASANVAGLMLTRFAARQRELAVRSALGAERRQICAGLLIEGGVLAVIGGVLGIATAAVLLRAMAAPLADLPRLATVSLSPKILVFSILITGLTGILCGAGPALWVSRLDLDPWLRQRGGASGSRGRSVLVAAQVGLATVLLASAGLLTITMMHLSADHGGIAPDGVLTMEVRLPEAAQPAEISEFFSALSAQMSNVPGVRRVGAISTLPFSGAGAQTDTGRVDGTTDQAVRTDWAVVLPGYFDAMGISLTAGRIFTERDRDGAAPVAVIDRQLAERLWPSANPIGQHLKAFGADLEVVGVVTHVKSYGVAATSREEMYVPLAQRSRTRMFLTLKLNGADSGTAALTALVRARIKVLNSSGVVGTVRTMADVVDKTVAGPRLAAALSLSFAAAALLLAVVGLAGLVAYLVELKRREIGVRMALGASPRAMIGQVVSSTVWLAVAGISIGLIGAAIAAQSLRAQLFGVSAHAAWLYAAVAAILLSSAVLASWLPARRAARVPLTIVLSD